MKPTTARLEHVRRGNCWSGARIDFCKEHKEPRGDCNECPKCPACAADRILSEAALQLDSLAATATSTPKKQATSKQVTYEIFQHDLDRGRSSRNLIQKLDKIQTLEDGKQVRLVLSAHALRELLSLLRHQEHVRTLVCGLVESTKEPDDG